MTAAPIDYPVSIQDEKSHKFGFKSLALISVDAFCFLNYRAEFIRSLVSEGVRVYAIGRFDDVGHARVAELGAEPIHLDIQSTGMSPIEDLRYVVRLKSTLEQLRPDATFAFFTKPLVLGSIAARAAGIPRRFAMVSGAGYAFTADGPRQRIARWALTSGTRFGLRHCHRVIFENDDDLVAFVARGSVRAGRASRVSGSGVSLERFEPAPFPESPLFLMLARPLVEKGVREFVIAARAVRRAHPGTRFVLLGGTTGNPGCLSADALADVAPVEWPGHVDDVRPWIAAATTVVLPSYREGLPRCLLEAMAMARPVIASDIAGCRDAVSDGETGILVPARDPRALAAAMCWQLENPERAKRMGLAGLARVRDRFDVHSVNAAIFRAITAEEPRKAQPLAQYFGRR
ncbi:MAG: glycosyltransferase family 4 protein [Sphingomonas sp.]|uniref:glycosyltransferase family 4 protein n=1 Tax=Sphingomonas sp. TaxID=28214 RepID=UPI001B117396|nr:glycosyltransferase family 4 protein [Sphingomonas sp.]MBO9623448.1 glycosyltransferase family 4 protein [Sphingomonas sp.]